MAQNQKSKSNPFGYLKNLQNLNGLLLLSLLCLLIAWAESYFSQTNSKVCLPDTHNNYFYDIQNDKRMPYRQSDGYILEPYDAIDPLLDIPLRDTLETTKAPFWG